jgi:nucleoid DNA-binding protein
MNKYLLEILKESNTIIIPGLGALTITDKEKGEIMFMSYLKHDDGKLSGYIADKDGIDEADAKNLVAKYVREIQTSLDKGDSFDMFEFGTFTKNAGGDIEFTSWLKKRKR